MGDGRTPITAALAMVAALGLAATAWAVDVRGSLDVQGTLRNPGNTDLTPPVKPYWQEWNGFLELGSLTPSPNRVLSVVLVGKGPPEPVGCGYALRDGDFDPTTMVAKKGTTLRIENTDPCAHELFSDDLSGFGPLQTAPGNARTVPLGKTGHFVVRDRLYPHIIGDLHVVDDLVACGEMDDRGRYQFRDVPDGNYTVKVFYGARQIGEKPVEASGRVVTVEPLSVSATQAK